MIKGEDDDYIPMVTTEMIQDEVNKIVKTFIALQSTSSETIRPIIENRLLTVITEIINDQMTPEALSRLCKALFKGQDLVFDDLESDFEAFLESESYYRLVSEIQRSKSMSGGFLAAQASQGFRGSSFQESQDYRVESRLSPKAKEAVRPSIILGQLYVELEREAARLTGAKEKDFPQGRAGAMYNVDDVLDEDLIAKLDAEVPMEDPKEKSSLLSGDDSNPPEIFMSSTKLQQVRDDLDCSMLQLDSLNMLVARAQPPIHVIQTPAQLMQTHILEQCQELVRQELSELTLQKIKYEAQEQKEAIVPGACTVKIRRTHDDMISELMERKRVTFYEVSVEKDAGMRRWSVKRRYNDFHYLHKKLKEKFPIVNEFELPGKTLTLFHSKVGKEELKKERMKALEKYLQVGYLLFIFQFSM
jgi:hypothetical protein